MCTFDSFLLCVVSFDLFASLEWIQTFNFNIYSVCIYTVYIYIYIYIFKISFCCNTLLLIVMRMFSKWLSMQTQVYNKCITVIILQCKFVRIRQLKFASTVQFCMFTIVTDGRLLYITPIDPLYLMLPYLVNAANEVGQPRPWF